MKVELKNLLDVMCDNGQSCHSLASLFLLFLLIGRLILVGLLNILILQNVAPVTCDLMSIVDLHHVKLLDNLSVNFRFASLEFRNDSLSEVDGYYVIQDAQGLDLFLSLYQQKQIVK